MISLFEFGFMNYQKFFNVSIFGIIWIIYNLISTINENKKKNKEIIKEDFNLKLSFIVIEIISLKVPKFILL